MATINNTIRVNVSEDNNSGSIAAKQFDHDSRFLRVILMNGSQRLTVDGESRVFINALRGDGARNTFEGELNPDGTVTVPLTMWMLRYGGMLTCDLTVISGDERLSTTSFQIYVQEGANPEMTETGDDPPSAMETVMSCFEELQSDISDIQSALDLKLDDAEGEILAAHIGSGAVTADKISNGAVTADKISNGAVTADKISNGAVTADKLSGGAVTTAKIADASVTNTKLALYSVELVNLSIGLQSRIAQIVTNASNIAALQNTVGALNDSLEQALTGGEGNG